MAVQISLEDEIQFSRRVTFEDTASGSDLIALGAVGSKVGTVMRGRKYRLLHTQNEFIIEELYKGDAPENGKVIILAEGGTYEQDGESYGVDVIGSIHVREGERLLVCLARVTGDQYRFAGRHYGRTTIIKDADGVPTVALATRRTDLLPTRLHTAREWAIPAGETPSGGHLFLPELGPFIRGLTEKPPVYRDAKEKRPR
ncbi:MAG: hypothetical protein ACE5HD_06045 [Acidobacteriota bacterium]